MNYMRSAITAVGWEEAIIQLMGKTMESGTSLMIVMCMA